jgi:hypothetical protein
MEVPKMARQPVTDASEVPEDAQFELPDSNEYHPAADKTAGVARHESVPDDVSAFLEEMNASKEFVCTLYRIRDGKKELVNKFRNQIPDNHETGIKYGPGDYLSFFSWTVPNRKTPDTRKILFSVSDDYTVPHRQYLDRLRTENVAPVAPQQNISDAIDIFAKIAPLVGGGKSDSSMILEMVRENNATTRELFKEIRDEMKEDRRRTDDKFDKLLTSLSNRETVKPKTLLEQLEEMRAMKTVLAEIGSDAPADNRPVWLQVVDSIGDKVAPLLDALSKGGIRAKVAEGQLKQGLQTDLGRRLLADREQQKLFLSNMLEKAETTEAKAGVLKLAQNLKIQVPENLQP